MAKSANEKRLLKLIDTNLDSYEVMCSLQSILDIELDILLEELLMERIVQLCLTGK